MMLADQLNAYYDETKTTNVRDDLLKAAELVGEPKIAIDCGCGAGSNIEFLASLGFTVYGFDIEEESILRCNRRFKHNDNVVLSQDSFSTFNYPNASLVLADASLFFCPRDEFKSVWIKIYECLFTGGIFCGSFLGPDDTMARAEDAEVSIWSSRLVFRESEVKSLFEYYEICHFTEHKRSGISTLGMPHDWHIFSVVAKKIA